MKVALAQLNGTKRSFSEQVEKFETICVEESQKGVELLAFPEAFLGPFDGQNFQLNDEATLLSLFKELARHHGLWLIPGSIWEISPHQGKAFNTSFLISPKGKVSLKYRKIHLFDVTLPSGEIVLESQRSAKGSEVASFKAPFGHLGLAICFDLRFPQQFLKMKKERGPLDLILLPSNFTLSTGALHFETLLRARAIENQCFVLSPNQPGKQEDGRKSYGSSMIIDPLGKVLQRASIEKEETIRCEIDLSMSKEIRESFPLNSTLDF